MPELEVDGEAVTLGILQELREMAEEISHGHMDYAARSGHKRTVAVCSNVTVIRITGHHSGVWSSERRRTAGKGFGLDPAA